MLKKLYNEMNIYEVIFMSLPVLIALITVLAVHYVLAIATIYLLMKDMGIVKAMIPWNIFILLIPILGPAVYLIYRRLAKKK